MAAVRRYGGKYVSLNLHQDASLEESSLLQRLREGDQQALADLFARERGRLERIVRFRLDPRLFGRVDVDDVLQETYLETLQRLPHYFRDPQVSFFVWLRSVTRQTLIDIHRRHLRAQARDVDREVSVESWRFPLATSASLASFLAADITSPSQAAMRDERAQQLQRALEELDEIDREVLALRHFEDLSNQEVAETLGISQKAASMRYVRALERLKEMLGKDQGRRTTDQ